MSANEIFVETISRVIAIDTAHWFDLVLLIRTFKIAFLSQHRFGQGYVACGKKKEAFFRTLITDIDAENTGFSRALPEQWSVIQDRWRGTRSTREPQIDIEIDQMPSRSVRNATAARV